MAIWGGRFTRDPDKVVADLSESISFDQRLYAHDIRGSIAHVRMLAKTGIVPATDADAIVAELTRIREEIDAGTFEFDTALEDIHMNIENRLIERLGDGGARIHAARSRNDQVATDIRLYLRDEITGICGRLRQLQAALVELGSANDAAILPGLTHLQNAQPVLFAHHLLAYVEMFERDRSRLSDCRARLNQLPLGAGALAGTTLPIDREFVAAELEFDGVMRNSMDAVSSRDFAIELTADLAIVMNHLSRLSEDIIFWASQACGYIELDDAFCTGSSLMPQKKNPDIAELTRGKTGRVTGALITLLTLMKGLPLCYNRDMQEDKEPLFDAIDTVKLVLEAYAPMIRTAQIRADVMAAAAADPALMATDLAEWLVAGGVPFRTAHHRVGRYVAWCSDHDISLDATTLEQMQETVPEAKAECLELFTAARSVAARNITGATAPAQVRAQLDFWDAELDKDEAV
jgi:argininosuccinate lyase